MVANAFGARWARVAALAVTMALAGCAGKLGRDVSRLAAVRLVHGGSSPAVDALLGAVYGPSSDLPAARALARKALADAPASGAAHEAAGYLAMLADDPDEVWLHFWTAAQDLDSPATALYLWELDLDPTRRQREANLALFDELRRRHPDPSVRAAAAVLEGRTLLWLGSMEDARAVVAPIAPIRDWQLLGGFDNEAGKGFLTEYAPEKKIDLAAAVPGPLVPLTWRPAPTSRLGTVLLGQIVSPSTDGVAYLATWVEADRDVDAQLRLTTGDSTRVWVDGGLVLSDDHVSQGDVDNLIAPVHLARGWNQILVKSAQSKGAWSIMARLSDGAGAPLAGVRVSRTPHAFRAQPDAAHAEELLPATFDRIAPAARRTFLRGRWLMRGGHSREALDELRSFVADAPSNLLATYFLALESWRHDEAGKAIDLLDDGVKRAGDTAPAFLHLRATYYGERHLYEKAQADYLRELQVTAAARGAQLGFAALLDRRGWRVEGCAELEAAWRKWPDSAPVAGDLAACRLALGYTREADALLARAHALEPGARTFTDRLADRAVSDGRLDDARRWLGELRRIEPHWPGHLVHEADVDRRQGRTADAERALAAAIALNPASARPYDALGSLLWEAGRTSDALAAWKKALERNPNDAVLAQRIELHEPTLLGFIEAYVPTAEDIDRALRRKLQPAPGAQQARLLDHEVTEVNADGSARRVVTEINQALDDHGRDALIAQRLPAQAKILQVYSIAKNGERQEASSIRGGEVRFRNLEVGSRVVVQYVHYMPAGQFLENHFATTWLFRSPVAQIAESRWVLVMPAQRPLHTHVAGPIHAEEQVMGDRRVRTWWVNDVAPIVAEPHAPPLGDLIWRVDVSTVPDWDDYVRWERALLTDAFRTDPQLDALADRLVEGAKTPREKLERLQRHVMREIRYQQDYEDTIAGVRPHASPVVLERGYGDCKDKATLLVQLAKRAGIKLSFALLRTADHGQMVRDVPNQQFNHAIVYVPAQPGIDEPFFLDPTPDALDLGNLPVPDQGVTSLVLDPDTGRWELIPIPYQPADRTYERLDLHVDIRSPSDARATGRMVLRGHAGLMMRHVLRNKRQAELLFQAVVGEFFPSAMLVEARPPADEDIGKPVELAFEIDNSRSIQERDGDYRLPLPGVGEVQGLVRLDRRELPLDLGVLAESTTRVEVALPEGYAAKHVPADFTVAAPCVELRRRHEASGRTVTVTTEIRYTCHEIAAADYPELRDKLRDAVNRLHDEVSFARAPAFTPAAVTVKRPRAAKSH